MIAVLAKEQSGVLVKERVANGPRCDGKKCEGNQLKGQQDRGVERKAKLRRKYSASLLRRGSGF